MDAKSNGLFESWGQHKHRVEITEEASLSFGPVIVLPGQVFVVSDYRSAGVEVSAYRMIPIGAIEARAVAVWLSWDAEADLLRWERLGHRLY
jgi:hypothetical protein